MAKYLSVSEESETLASVASIDGSWRRNRMLREAVWTMVSLVIVSGVAMLIIATTVFG